MNRSADRTSWFAALRRDGRLFAVVGALILLAKVLQPLAEAHAASTGKAWVICTVFGTAKPADADGTPLPAAAADDCPICLAGAPQLDNAPPPSDFLSTDWAFPEPAQTALVRWPDPEPVLLRPGPAEPPPGIRAPPSFA